MKILVVLAALCSVSLAAIVPALSSTDGCPPIRPGDVGICAFTCAMFGSGGCSAGRICCPTACGGTICVLEHRTRDTEKRAACPLGVMTVNCFVSPCMFAKCDSHPTATCKADYCGGCNADFYENGHKVHC